MKSTFSHVLSLKLTIMTLMLVGFFTLVPDHSVQAQNLQDDLSFSVPAGPYVELAEAKARVFAHIEFIKPQIDLLAPNTQPYRKLQAKVAFFSSVWETLESGKTVQESINAGLGIFKSDLYANSEKAYRVEFAQEAIDILTP